MHAHTATHTQPHTHTHAHSQSVHGFSCELDWQACNPAFSSYTKSEYKSFEGCKCQCCSGEGDCGCRTNGNGWCE